MGETCNRPRPTDAAAVVAGSGRRRRGASPDAVRPARTITRRAALGGAAAALALGGLGAFPGAAARAGEVLGILDQRAPELEVDYWLDGAGARTSYTLAEHRGKWIFLECFQNSCPGCHSYGFPTLKKIADAFADEPRVSVAAVQTVFEGFDVNTRAALRELQLRYELQIPLGHDPGTADSEWLPSTMVNYRIGGTPWMIVIEPGGTVAYNDYRIDGDRFIELLEEELG